MVGACCPEGRTRRDSSGSSADSDDESSGSVEQGREGQRRAA
eukprot:gene166-3557_t